METRKIIKFGKNSFVITISPKWLEKNNVKKADLVYVTEEGEDLKITADPKKEVRVEKTYMLDISGKHERDIEREIITAYINDFSTIEIKGPGVKEKSAEIREMLHNLVALEIMEQTSEKIIAKDFLDIENISVENLIRKIDNITRAMILDSRKTIDEDLYENIMIRDKDVNRIGFLIHRLVKEGLSNNRLRNVMKKTPLELHYDWRWARQIELIANDSKRIARVLKDLKADAKTNKQIDALYEEIENMYKDVFKARYNKDTALAIKQGVKKNELLKKCNAIEEKYGNIKHVPVLIEKLKSLIGNIHIAARVVYT